MPVYEYYCDECACRFEEFREVKQRTLCPCPQCSQPARKVFRPVGIIFKGSGFHSTDYRKPDGGEKREAERKKPEPAGASAKEESKDDQSGG